MKPFFKLFNFFINLYNKKINYFPSLYLKKQKASHPLKPTVKEHYHPLTDIYAEVNQAYFKNTLNLEIAWFGKKDRISSSKMVLGYYHEKKKIIKIHRKLDHSLVPRYFISYIIYHEMLHHVYPPIIKNRRRLIHHRDFKNEEMKFLWYNEAQKFIQQIKRKGFLFMIENKVYKEPPEDFCPKIKVAGCFCEWEDKILIAKRQRSKPYGNTWGLPAGKLEVGEDPEKAVIREVFEELGLKIGFGNFCFIGQLYMIMDQIPYIFHMFRQRFIEKPLIILDFSATQEVRWVTLKEAEDLPLIHGSHDVLSFYRDLGKDSEECTKSPSK